ncbi:ANTAGONIST OF LIKE HETEROCHROMATIN PROTEIN 1-like protein [Drosera capensis]
MEISSSFPPFLTQEDYSHFFSIFTEPFIDTTTTSIPATSWSDKRRRLSEEAVFEQKQSESSLKGILSSIQFGEGKLAEELLDWWAMAGSDEKDILEKHNKQSRATESSVDHYFDGDESPKQEEAVRSRSNKRARGTGSVASASASASIDYSGDSQAKETVVAQKRRLWVKERANDWWERCNSSDYPDEEFKRDFRMSKATFNMICEGLEPVITKKDTMLRTAIPVRQRVAVCIWRLATGEALRLVSRRFGLGISTCHKLVLEVSSAIRAVLMPKFLQWPDEARMKRIKEEFERSYGIPNVGGAMYTTHVPIIAPKDSVSAYFNKRHTERNQKTSYSITVQGVVDDKGTFTDVCIGWPGSLPDDQVLEKSALFQRATRGLLKDVWLVGNSGYPLLDWVLVPYTDQRTWTQHAFNEKVGDVQSVAKEAFAKLKARWGCLQKRTEVKLQDLPVVLGACCVLHNICEMRNEELDPALKFELFDDEIVPENCVRSASSVQARDHIAHNLLHHGHAGASFI